jgi:hypothetical protein
MFSWEPQMIWFNFDLKSISILAIFIWLEIIFWIIDFIENHISNDFWTPFKVHYKKVTLIAIVSNVAIVSEYQIKIKISIFIWLHLHLVKLQELQLTN